MELSQTMLLDILAIDHARATLTGLYERGPHPVVVLDDTAIRCS